MSQGNTRQDMHAPTALRMTTMSVPMWRLSDIGRVLRSRWVSRGAVWLREGSSRGGWFKFGIYCKVSAMGKAVICPSLRPPPTSAVHDLRVCTLPLRRFARARCQLPPAKVSSSWFFLVLNATHCDNFTRLGSPSQNYNHSAVSETTPSTALIHEHHAKHYTSRSRPVSAVLVHSYR